MEELGTIFDKFIFDESDNIGSNESDPIPQHTTPITKFKITEEKQIMKKQQKMKRTLYNIGNCVGELYERQDYMDYNIKRLEKQISELKQMMMFTTMSNFGNIENDMYMPPRPSNINRRFPTASNLSKFLKKNFN